MQVKTPDNTKGCWNRLQKALGETSTKCRHNKPGIDETQLTPQSCKKLPPSRINSRYPSPRRTPTMHHRLTKSINGWLINYKHQQHTCNKRNASLPVVRSICCTYDAGPLALLGHCRSLEQQFPPVGVQQVQGMPTVVIHTAG